MSRTEFTSIKGMNQLTPVRQCSPSWSLWHNTQLKKLHPVHRKRNHLFAPQHCVPLQPHATLVSLHPPWTLIYPKPDEGAKYEGKFFYGFLFGLQESKSEHLTQWFIKIINECCWCYIIVALCQKRIPVVYIVLFLVDKCDSSIIANSAWMQPLDRYSQEAAICAAHHVGLGVEWTQKMNVSEHQKSKLNPRILAKSRQEASKQASHILNWLLWKTDIQLKLTSSYYSRIIWQYQQDRFGTCSQTKMNTKCGVWESEICKR